MVRKPNGNGKVVARLVQIAEETEDSAHWRELAVSLNEQKKQSIADRMEVYLRVAKAMRAAGVLDELAAHYAVSHAIIMIAEDRIFGRGGTNPSLDALSEKMQAIEREHGLSKDEYWPKGQGPEEYNRLSDEFDRTSDAIIAATFDEFGESELGAMYRHDHERFDQLTNDGRKKYFQSRKPRH